MEKNFQSILIWSNNRNSSKFISIVIKEDFLSFIEWDFFIYSRRDRRIDSITSHIFNDTSSSKYQISFLRLDFHLCFVSSWSLNIVIIIRMILNNNRLMTTTILTRRILRQQHGEYRRFCHWIWWRNYLERFKLINGIENLSNDSPFGMRNYSIWLL